VTPADYVNEIVIPTIREFGDKRRSRRHAYLACIVTFHIKDHLKVAGESDIDVVMRSSDSKAFDLVRSVCNGTKHVSTHSTHSIAFKIGADYERPPSLAGVAMCGLSYVGDTKGGREIAQGSLRIDIYGACRETLEIFQKQFPAQLGTCNLSGI